jgi:D-glycerate 3-kinase
MAIEDLPGGPAVDRLLRRCGVADPKTWWDRCRLRLDAAGPLVAPVDPLLLQAFALPLLERLRVLASTRHRPVLALNAPVGSGKTSLCRLLLQLAPAWDLRLAVASIDDFYLPWAERRIAMTGNPFGVTRVPPGSHDPGLFCEVVDRWRRHGCLDLPRFDKTLRGGEGDRCAGTSPAADALLLEGWLVGCRPLDEGVRPPLDPQPLQDHEPRLREAECLWLPRWDRALRAYRPAWSRLDELWLMRPQAWNLPRRWRFQAEARQRRQGGAALSAAALDALVRASLCSLPPHLYQNPLLRGLEASAAPSPSEPPVLAAAVIDGRRRLRRLISR